MEQVAADLKIRLVFSQPGKPRGRGKIERYFNTINVFHDEKFLCRASYPELAARSIGIKEITAARNARRRGLMAGLTQRAGVVDRLLAAHQPTRAGTGRAHRAGAEALPGRLTDGHHRRRRRHQ